VGDTATLRLFVLRVVVLSMLVTLLGRLAYLQVWSGDDFVQAASQNRVREVVTPAARGTIVDVTGAPLVRNRAAMVVTVDRARLRGEDDGGAAVLDRLGALLGRTGDDLARAVTPCGDVEPPCWRGSPYQPVPVAEFDAADAEGLRRVLAVEERRELYPGVRVELTAVRDTALPDPTTAGARAGLPRSDQRRRGRHPCLRGRAARRAWWAAPASRRTTTPRCGGRDGVERLVVDHVGGVTGRESAAQPVTGDSLVLSLHAGVQAVAESALQRAVERARTIPARGGGGALLQADSGAVVVMEARTGRLVALASYPSYDPSVFVGGRLARAVRRPRRRGEGRAAALPHRAGRVRAGVDLQGRVDAGGRGQRRLPARRHLPVPGHLRAAGRQAQLRGRRAGRHGPAQGPRRLLRHDLLQDRLRAVAGRRRQRAGGAAARPDPGDGARVRPGRADRRRPAERAPGRAAGPRVPAGPLGRPLGRLVRGGRRPGTARRAPAGRARAVRRRLPAAGR
jgi:hypothetical protein